MGTNNFLNINASNIYSVEIQEEYDYDDLLSNLQYELKKKGYDAMKEFDNDRSFCGRYFAQNTFTVKKNNQYIYITIKAIVRNGYYAGVNLDYEYSIEVEKENCWDNEVDLESPPEGFKTLAKKAKAKLKKEIKELEKVFNDYSTPLRKVGQFNNGEAIYQRLEA